MRWVSSESPNKQHTSRSVETLYITLGFVWTITRKVTQVWNLLIFQNWVSRCRTSYYVTQLYNATLIRLKRWEKQLQMAVKVSHNWTINETISTHESYNTIIKCIFFIQLEKSQFKRFTREVGLGSLFTNFLLYFTNTIESGSNGIERMKITYAAKSSHVRKSEKEMFKKSQLSSTCFFSFHTGFYRGGVLWMWPNHHQNISCNITAF